MSHGNARHALSAKDASGNELTVASETRDAPFLPVDDLIRLNAANPDFAREYLAMTKAEGEFRRKRITQVNWFTFWERMAASGEVILGQFFGFATVGLLVGGGVYCVVQGHDLAGASFVTGGILAGAAAVFVHGRAAKVAQASLEKKQSESK